MKALVLAGDSEEKSSTHFEENKALIKINNKEMILYVIEALKKLDFIEQITVVGNRAKLSGISDNFDLIIDQGESLSINLMKGAQAFEDHEELMVLSSDIPMITPDALRDFVEKAHQHQADLYYPIVTKEHNEAKYP
jgi:molybdopterin-guanine dinucleotide biosynthesis protein A